MKRFFSLVLCLMLLAALAVPAFAAESGYEEGDIIPDFTVTTYDGRELSLYQVLEEKDMVLINIWATWCPPCRMEFPYMEEAYQLYKDDIEIIALSCEPSDSDKVLADFAEEMGISFPLARDTLNLAGKLGVSAIPLSLIVDKEGVIRFKEVGARFETEAFTKLFDEYVSAEEKSGGEAVDYVVSFVDDKGEPVRGVLLQVCDESLCQVFASDSNGECRFTLPPYAYELHLLVLPLGYVYDGQTPITTAENGGEVKIELDRA